MRHFFWILGIGVIFSYGLIGAVVEIPGLLRADKGSIREAFKEGSPTRFMLSIIIMWTCLHYW